MLNFLLLASAAFATDWSASGITGDPNSVPFFDGSGNPVEVDPLPFVTGIVNSVAPPIVDAAIASDVPPLIDDAISLQVPDLIDDAIVAADIAGVCDTEIDLLVPDLIDDAITLQVPGICDDEINLLVPDLTDDAIAAADIAGVCDTEINSIVPGLIDAAIASDAPPLIDAAIASEVPGLIDDAISLQVPDLIDDAIANLTLDAIVPLAHTALNVGSTRWASYMQVTAGSTGSGNFGPNIIGLQLYREETLSRVYDQIGIYTTTNGVGYNIQFGLYELAPSGEPGDLLWNSGTILAAANSMRSVTFASGTWTSAGAVYQDASNNLVLDLGDEILLAEAHSGIVGTRTFSISTIRQLGVSQTATSPVTGWELNSSFGTWPASASLAAVDTGELPFLVVHPL